MSETGWANLDAEIERLKAESRAGTLAEPQSALPEYAFDLFTSEEKPAIAAAYEKIYHRPATRDELESCEPDRFL